MVNSKSIAHHYFSINKVVCDLTTVLEGNLKDLYSYEEEIKDHMEKRKCDET